MGNSRIRALIILVALIIVAVVAYRFGYIAGTKAVGPTAALVSAKLVFIGPNVKTVNPQSQTLSFRNKDVVYWKPWPPSEHTGVGVTFKAPFPDAAKGEPPFVGGTPNADQTILCGGGNCFSYDINPNLGPILRDLPTHSLTYDYWQSLDGGPLADARIIINW